MKKIIVIYLVCIIGLFFLPVILIKEYKPSEEQVEKSVTQIKLLISETGEIIEMSLDDYIMGVLIGEMPVTYEIEALKAQAVVARTYTLNKILNSPASHENADMCDNINHCQAYKTKEYALSCWSDSEENEKWNKIKKAVLDTKNEVIVYNNELINAFFHANSGGKTEDISNIWGHETIPYLKSVSGNEIDELKESVFVSYQEIDEKMKEKYTEYQPLLKKIEDENIEDIIIDTKSNTNINLTQIELLSNSIKILERNSSGRVSKIQISNIILDGTEARTIFGLRSTLFDIETSNEKLIFKTKGYRTWHWFQSGWRK